MKKLTKSVLLWAAALILVGAAIFIAASKPGGGLDGLAQPLPQDRQVTLVDAAAREKAPGFTLTDLNGSTVSLDDLKGKNVYLNFWATWCPWCKQELPDIDKLAREYGDKNLVVLTVDVGEDKATVQRFVQDNGYTFGVLLDTDSSVSRLYGVSSIPVSVFIDQNGTIAQKTVGAMTSEQMRDVVSKLLAE